MSLRIARLCYVNYNSGKNNSNNNNCQSICSVSKYSPEKKTLKILHDHLNDMYNDNLAESEK